MGYTTNTEWTKALRFFKISYKRKPCLALWGWVNDDRIWTYSVTSSLLKTKTTTQRHILSSELLREEMAEENMSVFHQSQISLRDASARSDTCRHTFLFQTGPVRADWPPRQMVRITCITSWSSARELSLLTRSRPLALLSNSRCEGDETGASFLQGHGLNSIQLSFIEDLVRHTAHKYYADFSQHLQSQLTAADEREATACDGASPLEKHNQLLFRKGTVGLLPWFPAGVALLFGWLFCVAEILQERYVFCVADR